MCRLFGLIANKPVNIYFSFFQAKESVKKLSETNPHGWGMGWYDENKTAKIYKEPLPLYSSKKSIEIVENVHSKIIIAHVRYATCGKPKYENTHPFKYDKWIFAHNGSVNKKYIKSKLNNKHLKALEGETDSEALFHLILQKIEEQKDPIKGIKTAINEACKTYFTSLNFILSNGIKLYALRYASQKLDYYTLYYLKRPARNLELNHLSKETKLLIQSKLATGEKAIVIASEKLTKQEENWQPIPNKHLIEISKNLTTKITKISLNIG
ncbi:MAG: class II glutamine amidotransferase [Candidatus Odinarchaeota archaeon]|nr:class II glutamine amidotransferase [Candidatus Odinarchaeota archaeon]